MLETIKKGFFVAALILIAPVAVSAAEVWPESFDVEISAGEVGDADLVVVNDSPYQQTYRIDLLQANFDTATEEFTFSPATRELQSWIELDGDTLSLAAETQGKVGITFAPTKRQSGQVETIGIQITELQTPDSGLAVQTAFISLGFITVDSVGESVAWLDYELEASVFADQPLMAYLTVRNEGERIVIPQGTMRISSLFGREIASVDVNPHGFRVLQGQARTFTTQWIVPTIRQTLLFGVYSVETTVQPWEEGDVFYARQHIILFQPITAIVLLVLLFGIERLFRFLRDS